MSWPKRTKPPVDYTIGQQILIDMAHIEVRLRRGIDPDETIRYSHADTLRQEYHQLLAAWWQLDTTNYTHALQWAYRGNLKSLHLPSIHLRSLLSVEDMPRRATTKALVARKSERTMIDQRDQILTVARRLTDDDKLTLNIRWDDDQQTFQQL